MINSSRPGASGQMGSLGKVGSSGQPRMSSAKGPQVKVPSTKGMMAKSPSHQKQGVIAPQVSSSRSLDSRSARRAPRDGQGGFYDTVAPKTSSRESKKAHSKRMGREKFTTGVKRRSFIKRFVTMLIIILLVLGIAGGIGWAVYQGILSGRMDPGDDVSDVTVSTSADKPYYVAICADLNSNSKSDGVIDTVTVVRVDEANCAISLLNVPANIQVLMSDELYHPLSYAFDLGGASEFISALSYELDIDFAHFVLFKEQAIRDIVDKLGGLDVYLEQEVDDPSAGSIYLQKGEHTLNADEALVYLRATNFSDGLTVRAQHQNTFVAAAFERIVSEGAFSRMSLLDKGSSNMRSDWKPADMVSFLGAFKGLTASSILSGWSPGYELTRENVTYFITYSSMSSILDLFKAGSEPVIKDDSTEVDVDPSSFTLEIKNGSGGAGLAGTVSNSLKSQGFNVTAMGNAEAYVYDETLVIYGSEEHRASAQAVANALGVGRVIASQGFYALTTDVLLIIGGDY